MRKSRGFTLIETVMALAIFAMAVGAIVGFQARGYINDARARDLTIATDLAREKMTELQLDIEKELSKGSFPQDKTEDGQFEKPFEDYKWKMELKTVEVPKIPVGDEQGEIIKLLVSNITDKMKENFRELKVTITWTEMEKEKDLSVVTHIVKM